MAAEHPKKVMLLDDERFLLGIYKISFERRGFEAVTFSDPDGALDALRQGYQPDVILFDITLPQGRSGYEFIETVKRESLAKHALKIVLSNEGRDGARMRLEELGADEHLLKAQYVPAELVQKVQELLAKKRR